MSLMDLSATALAAEIVAGRATPIAAAEAALERANSLNPILNAFAEICPDVLDQARSVRIRLAKGETLPLAGVPVVIKDNIWVKGLPITQGSRLFADFVAPEDAVAVRRLRAAGAVILGIGTCSEFACKGVTNTPLHGITRNPADPSRTPGGSSGGCAAAVAARIVPLALGTDAGGSSRRPPAHVGVIGFKPSQDLVPYGPGFEEPVWGISVIAPIARDIEDIRLAMSVLADLEPGDPLTGSMAFAPDFGLGQRLDPDMSSAFDSAIARMRETGLDLIAAAPDWDGLGGASVMPLQHAGLAALHGAAWRATPDLFDPDLGAQIECGLALDGVAVSRAHHASHRIGTILSAFLTRFDAILVPTTPCAAWPVGQVAPTEIAGVPCGPRDHAAFTPQANHAGCPAISIPCGATADGLPLGLQVIAARGRDAGLLALASQIAQRLAGPEQEKVP